ncbi:MAG: aminotransferase class III-fold pyridoxal phosphate-dependent enzyme [Gammaproteobacteria bacterium]|nr:aminotransferase class III-fold pyridoxal phosphate-dependent enzyme [Gammaproteobacteria bacterium]
MSSTNPLLEGDRQHHVHGQTNLRQHEEQGPSVMVTEGHGVYIKTEDGRELIDGFSGLGCTSLGYHNDRLAAAAKKQMDTLPFAPTFYGRSHPKVAELAERLVKMAAVPMDRVMFQCSGSEANDAMIKFLWYRNIARGQPERRKLISRWRGYYGNTVATASLSGQPHMHANFGLPMDDFLKLSTPNYYHCHEDAESEEEFSARLAREFEDLVLATGPDKIAAFFAEPMQSGGGAILPPKAYWKSMQAVIRKYDIHFHVDEVVCGFGRTGYRWGAEAFNLKPDSTSCAKALTAAFFPMSALMFKEDFYQDMVKNSDEIGVLGHGYTYSGHPVGAAIALEALDIYDEIDLIGHVREVSPHFLDACYALMEHPLVGDARGIGLFCGIELVKDKKTREQYDPALKIGQRVQDAAHAGGLYLRTIAPDRISFMPPLIIEKSEIDAAAAILRKALDSVWEEIRK